MKLDLVDVGAVGGGLGFGNAAKDLARLCLDASSQVGLGDAGVDVGVG